MAFCFLDNYAYIGLFDRSIPQSLFNVVLFCFIAFIFLTPILSVSSLFSLQVIFFLAFHFHFCDFYSRFMTVLCRFTTTLCCLLAIFFWVIVFWLCFLPSWVWTALLKMCKCSRKWCIKFTVFKTLQPCFYISPDPCPEVGYIVTPIHFLQTLGISSSLFCIISPPPLSCFVYHYCCHSKICRPSQYGQSRLLTMTLTEVMIQGKI